MKELGINNNLIGWTQIFLTDRLVQFVIDGFIKLREKVKLGIPQGLPVFPILFLIYISRVFLIIEE